MTLWNPLGDYSVEEIESVCGPVGEIIGGDDTVFGKPLPVPHDEADEVLELCVRHGLGPREYEAVRELMFGWRTHGQTAAIERAIRALQMELGDE